MIRFVLCVPVLFCLAACSGNESADNSGSGHPANGQAAASLSLPKVLEVFEIGQDVYARALAVDEKNNSLWVGTSVGVQEVDLDTRQVKRTVTRKEGLANEYVFAIFVDRQGRKWFGTNGGGMSRYDNTDWKTFFPMHGLADYWVYSIGEQSSGALWVGTWAGVNRIDPVSHAMTTYVKELINEWVYGIAVDQEDRVWFGTEGGVSMFDGSRWRSWNHDDGLGAPNRQHLPISPNTGLGTRSRHNLDVLVNGRETYNPNYVFCMVAASDGSMLAGTWGGGVSRYDGDHWSNLTTRDGLAGDIVFSMVEDKKGVLWFGTNKGLSRYDGKTWQTIDREQGLDDDHVYALAAAPDGTIWAGTKDGVARIGTAVAAGQTR